MIIDASAVLISRMKTGHARQRKHAWRPGQKRREPMDTDQKELVRHLFAKVSGLAEAAHEIAIMGQSAGFESTDYIGTAQRLHDGAQGMQNITNAIITIIGKKCD